MPVDTTHVPLPPRHARALTLLTRRCLELPPTADGARRAEAVLRALFGAATPQFGRLTPLTRDAVRDAVHGASERGVPVSGIDDLTLAARALTPTTPICPACEEPALAVSAGLLEAPLHAGVRCPFCDRAALTVEPICVRRLAWTTAALVSPEVTSDRTVRPGEVVPLLDADLPAWLGASLDPDLARALAHARLDLSGWLAWAWHSQRKLQGPEDAAAVASRPDRFGWADAAAVRESGRAAAAWVARTDEARWIGPADAAPGPRVRLGKFSLRVLTRLAVGAHCDVYLVARPEPAPALGVLHVLRDGDPAAFARVTRDLRMLSRSQAQGAAWFCRGLPQVEAHDELLDADDLGGAPGPRPARLTRWRPGCLVGLPEARRVHAAGLPGPVVVWAAKRLLETLGFLHRAGWVHGAIAPEHVLLHPRDHGAVLAGWSALEPRGPSRTANRDLTALGATLTTAAGGDPSLGVAPPLPAPVAAFLARLRDLDPSGDDVDAWALTQDLSDAARAAWGPGRHHPLPMPGWPTATGA